MDMTVNGGVTDTAVSKITGTFSGSDSYWFGDEASSENTSADGRKNAKGVLDLTFTNGAQWSYLAVAGEKTIDKRISSITLRDGGIINLFDDNLEAFWDEIGLLPLLKEGNYDVEHNYVRIGDLKGSDGIFRLDLNSDDRTQSDMVFIESSNQGVTGLNLIAPLSSSVSLPTIRSHSLSPKKRPMTSLLLTKSTSTAKRSTTTNCPLTTRRSVLKIWPN